jgi:hypothetical protein
MPVNQLRCVGIVVDVYDSTLPLLESKQRPWKLAVIERRRDDVLGCELDKPGGNAQRVVGLGFWRRGGLGQGL